MVGRSEELAVECQYHLAVAACLEDIAPLKLATDVLMVVNLAIDGQYLLVAGTEEGLSARLGVDDRQALMRQYG